MEQGNAGGSSGVSVSMTTPTSREIRWLALAALAPIALGYAMHEEHRAMQGLASTVTVVESAPQVIPIPIATVVEVPAASPVEPEPTPTPVSATLAYGDAFSFVISDERPLLVLSTEPSEAWATTSPAPTYARWSEVHLRREIDPARLPAEISARLTARFDLFDGTDRKCTAELGVPYLYGDISGDWDYRDQDENGEPDDVDPAAAWTEGRRLLVAPVIGEGDCTGATWARNAALPDARVFTRVDRPGLDRTKLARRAYMRLPALEEARAEFEQFQRGAVEEPSSVEPVPLGRRMKSTGWTNRAGDLVAITHWIDGPEFGGCGGVAARWGFAAVSDDGATVDRVLDGGYTKVQTLLDIDGDGTPEVVTSPYDGWQDWQVLTLRPEGWTTVAAMTETPYFGCPC